MAMSSLLPSKPPVNILSVGRAKMHDSSPLCDNGRWRKAILNLISTAVQALNSSHINGNEPNHVIAHRLLAPYSIIPSSMESHQLVGLYHCALAMTYGIGNDAEALYHRVRVRSRCHITLAAVYSQLALLKLRRGGAALSEKEKDDLTSLVRFQLTQIRVRVEKERPTKTSGLMYQLLMTMLKSHQLQFAGCEIFELELLIATHKSYFSYGAPQSQAMTPLLLRQHRRRRDTLSRLLISLRYGDGDMRFKSMLLFGVVPTIAMQSMLYVTKYNRSAAAMIQLKRMKQFMTDQKINTKFFGIQLLMEVIVAYPNVAKDDTVVNELYRTIIEVCHRLEYISMSHVYRTTFISQLIHHLSRYIRPNDSSMYWFIKSIWYRYRTMFTAAMTVECQQMVQRTAENMPEAALAYDTGLSILAWKSHGIERSRTLNKAALRFATIHNTLQFAARHCDQVLNMAMDGTFIDSLLDARMVLDHVPIYLKEYTGLWPCISGDITKKCAPPSIMEAKHASRIERLQPIVGDTNRNEQRMRVIDDAIRCINKGRGHCDTCGKINGITSSVLSTSTSVERLNDFLATPYQSQWTTNGVTSLPSLWSHCTQCKSAWFCSSLCVDHHSRESCSAHANHINVRPYHDSYPNLSLSLPSIFLSSSTLNTLQDID